MTRAGEHIARLERQDMLAEWIEDPAKVHPGALMPTLGLSKDDARDVRALGAAARKSLVTPEWALERWGGSRLVARHEETSGRPIAEVRGMPLGLAGLSAEDIQLVETWVSEGAPLR